MLARGGRAGEAQGVWTASFRWWRIWHHRHDVIFSQGDASVSHSVSFLQKYIATLQALKNGTVNIVRKGGKGSHDIEAWKKPAQDWGKFNVDARYTWELKCGA